MNGNAVKLMIQTALKPEIEKMETSNSRALTDLAAKVEACQEQERNTPSQLQDLQKEIRQLKDNDKFKYVEEAVKKISDDVKRCVDNSIMV